MFLDSFNFNRDMPVGLGAEYNLICDLIHISHKLELGWKGSVLHFGSFPPLLTQNCFLIQLGPDFEDSKH